MEHFVTVKALKIRYLEKGSAIPVVLLHGYSFRAETWVEMGLFDELAKKYKVYSFDMPYGLKSSSDKFDTANRDEYAVFLKDLLWALDIHKPILLGASISGEVVLRYLISGYDAKAGIVAGPAGVQVVSAGVSRITVPLLAVWGKKDTISPPGRSKILEAHVKGCEVHLIEDAGHACYLDKPEEFKIIVLNFLKNLFN